MEKMGLFPGEVYFGSWLQRFESTVAWPPCCDLMIKHLGGAGLGKQAAPLMVSMKLVGKDKVPFQGMLPVTYFL